MTQFSFTSNSVIACISSRSIEVPVVFGTTAHNSFRLFTWAVAIIGFVPTMATSVPLPDPAPSTSFLDVAITGTTVAARPELGGVVIEDVLKAYEFTGTGSFLKGTVQNRVVRSDADGTFDFYWRVRPDISSTGDINAFRVNGFDAFPLDADWRSDGLGVESPDTARHFGSGSVNFLFSNRLGEQSEDRSSRFFFLDTEATQYATDGEYDMNCPDVACISPLFSTFAPVQATPDLAVIAIGGLKQVGIRSWRGPQAPNVQDSHYGGDPAPGGTRGTPIVGFTLFVTAKNVSPDPDGPGPMSAPAIPWFFPVVETSANPWIIANDSLTFPNGFTGQEGGYNHMHDQPPQPELPGGHALEVGPHPHIIHRIFRKPIGSHKKELIGHSDLKHTYLFGPPALHEAKPGKKDSYSTTHNQDQSFYSPISEIDPDTFMVAAHDHMGSPYSQLGSGHHRDHGELEFSGSAVIPADPGHPGDDNIDHILQARVDWLSEPGFCHYLTGTYYVVNDVDQADFDNSNNTFWRQFSPGWHAGKFDPVMLSDSGEGLNTIDSHVCAAPSNASTDIMFVVEIDTSTLPGIEAGGEITGTLKVDPDIRDQDDDPRVGRFEDPFLPAQFDGDYLDLLAKLAGYTIVLDAPFPDSQIRPNPVDRIVIETVYDDALNDMIMGDLHDPVMGSETDLDLGIGSLFRTTLHFEPGTLIGDALTNLPVGEFDPSGDVLRFGQFEIVDHEGVMRVRGSLSSASISARDLLGDFNRDGTINAVDIDLLRIAINTGSADLIYDVNGGGLDGTDFDFAVQAIIDTAFGDADLNKKINFTDFVSLSNHFGSRGTGWGQGNFNLDDITNFADFVFLSNNYGTDLSSGVLAETPSPEPASLVLLVVTVGFVVKRRGGNVL